MKRLLLVAALAALAPLAAQAESNFVTGAGALTAAAKLDFSITIPKVLFLQVGTGTNFSNITTVDSIGFSVPAASVGNGTAVAGSGGDLTNGAVTVRVRGNGGNVTLDNSVSGPLSNGSGATVQWSEITVTPGTLASTTPGFTNAAITHPPFNTTAGGGTSATPTALAATGGMVRKEGSWTFAYANSAIVPAGTYGTSANNGQVTYTAATP
jgi:hypothetical protein